MISVSEISSELLTVLFEQGMVTRLKELLEERSTKLQEIALRTLCAIIRSPCSNLFKKMCVVVSSKHETSSTAMVYNSYAADNTDLFFFSVMTILSSINHPHTLVDILSAVAVLLDIDFAFSVMFAQLGMLHKLVDIISMGSYDLKVLGGDHEYGVYTFVCLCIFSFCFRSFTMQIIDL